MYENILPVESFCNKYDEDIGNYIISYIILCIHFK